jgi:hypothetical protein
VPQGCETACETSVGLGALLLLLVALRAGGGASSGVPAGACGQVLKSAAGGKRVRLLFAYCYRLMASVDPNDLMSSQEKLEWVTPKISLMVAGDTEGSNKTNRGGEYSGGIGPSSGPS